MRWDTQKAYKYIQLGKRIKGEYGIQQIYDFVKKYKYTYKATQNFFRCEFDGKYSLYILSNEDLDYLMVFLNKLKVIKMIAMAHTIHNTKTLYNIKEKIEII